MASAWALGVVLAIAAETTTDASIIPAWASAALRIVGQASIAALLLFLLWQYRNRLTESARELGGLVTLSRDLADTMDPHLVGERMARHLAEVSGAAALHHLQLGSARWTRWSPTPPIRPT